MLPPAPLGGRVAVASVWTGTCWWLWGGRESWFGAGLADGAVYSHGTDSWRVLPLSDLPEHGEVAAVLVGGQVVVIAQSAVAPHVLTAAAYDLAGDIWTALPAPVGTRRPVRGALRGGRHRRYRAPVVAV